MPCDLESQDAFDFQKVILGKQILFLTYDFHLLLEIFYYVAFTVFLPIICL